MFRIADTHGLLGTFAKPGHCVLRTTGYPCFCDEGRATLRELAAMLGNAGHDHACSQLSRWVPVYFLVSDIVILGEAL